MEEGQKRQLFGTWLPVILHRLTRWESRIAPYRLSVKVTGEMVGQLCEIVTIDRLDHGLR